MTTALETTQSTHDFVSGAGHMPAICELVCPNCGDGMRFDQEECALCGLTNLRFAMLVPGNPGFCHFVDPDERLTKLPETI